MPEIYFTDKDTVYTELEVLLKRRIPSPFELKRTENGKPYIEGDPLFFSISHSGGKAVIALHDRRVGIDLETLDEKKHTAVLSRFTDRERNETKNYKDFLIHWTAREAYVKMLGSTIAQKFRRLEFYGGVMYDGGAPSDCEFIHGERDGCIYSLCIDKRG